MIRSTASRQFRVLDCSASIEVPDFPYHTDKNFFPKSPAKFPLISNPACGPASSPRENQLLFASLTPYLFQEKLFLFCQKTKFKYSKSRLLQFSRNEVPAKTEINNDEISFHNTLSIRYMLHCCKPAFCVIYTIALFRSF